ncbi:hypothetical protein CAI16_18860 [Virgibacillus dokdonensis]|uniref:NADP-dependent oxidoreductase domain-containing protein n=1 Tax=Virgibacillus dokdonensis TaxID=302167 RepID=A0A3E0WH20_9BACI|nr:hypothetical protein CAI16_18860 [Virgibacillus dokdonensis]
MEFPNLNKVSRIGLGTWAISGWMWGGTNENEALKTIYKALDMGINIIDTAPQYGFGVAEKIIGKVIDSVNREDIVIATKAGINWDESAYFWRDCSRKRILQEIENSLKRLNTEYIDLYQVHWPDPEVPIEVTAETLNELYNKGKIRAIGVSNFNIDQMERWMKVAPLHSNQLPLSIFNQSSKRYFEYCYINGIKTITYGTLAHGLLTGKITENTTFKKDDHRAQKAMFNGLNFIEHLSAVNDLKKLAREIGVSIAQLAVRWSLYQKGVSICLWGARKPEQLEEVIEIFEWIFTDNYLKEVDSIIKEKITRNIPVKKKPGPPIRSEMKYNID